MTVRHLALLRFTEGTTGDQVAELVAALEELPSRIDEIRTYSVGADLGLAEGTWDLGIDGTFDDADAWRRYQDHPEHQRVLRDHVRPILAERAAVQLDEG